MFAVEPHPFIRELELYFWSGYFYFTFNQITGRMRLCSVKVLQLDVDEDYEKAEDWATASS